jgi:ribokinase
MGEGGRDPRHHRGPESYTGAAYIFIEEATGNNAIIISPGAAGRISVADVEARADLIGGASVFVTQLEQPMDAAHRALEIARAGGARTILNPAPAAEIAPEMLALCDYVTPNESEAEGITGIAVRSIADADRGRRTRFWRRAWGRRSSRWARRGALP